MNREQIKALSLEPKDIYTQAWGKVCVRQLRADELQSLLDVMDLKGAPRLARLCILGCVDSEGRPLFRFDDIDWLTRSALEPLAEIADAFLELNGVTDALEPEKKSDLNPSNTTLSILPTGGDTRTRA